MCFISHNKLILIIAFLSIILGTLTFVSSSLVVHHSDDLKLVTVQIKFLIACTFCTIGAGIIQAVSSLLYASRRLVTRNWIQANAIVFGIFLLGISIAMVRFQSTLPGGFDPKVVSNRTETIDQLRTLRQELVTTTVSTVEVEEDNDELIVSMTTESEPDTDLEPDTGPKRQVDLEELVAKKTVLLKFYFASILLDFLALPIFLGLVSSKSSKFDLKAIMVQCSSICVETLCVILGACAVAIGFGLVICFLHRIFCSISWPGFVSCIWISGIVLWWSSHVEINDVPL